MSFAEGTSVPIERSQGEIRKTLDRYKATGFAFGERPGQHVVMFEMAKRRIQIAIPMPIAGVTRGGKKNYLMSQNEVDKESRRRWRCLVLVIKAKLECVDSGITTLEQEFMAHIVLPGGQTVGVVMLPQIANAYETGKMPPLLGYDGG